MVFVLLGGAAFVAGLDPLALTGGRGGPRIRAAQEDASIQDRITLKDGRSLDGVLLDLDELRVVFRLQDGTKRFLERSEVASISRGADRRAVEFFQEKAAKAVKERHWRALASFARKYHLYPELRTCLRRLLEFDPTNEELHLELGEAKLDGEWLSEEEVAKKLAEGYRLEGGVLVKAAEPAEAKTSGGDGPTAVAEAKKVELPKNIRILPRKELTPQERQKIEEERRKRIENARRFREKLRREYEGVDWSKRYIVRTKHFEIHCNATYELAKRYGAIMELIRAELAEKFRSPVYRTTRAPVFIYRNQEDFINNDEFGRWGGRGLGGYYIPINQRITTYHGTFGFTGTTFSVLAHEGTHYYQGLVLKGGFDNIPIWLIEGLAVYFGDGSRFDPVKVRITTGLIPRDRLAHIQEKMRRKRHTPVEKLVGMTRYTGFSGSHYADAWALIYFLVKSGKKGERLLQEYWARGLERKLEKRDFLELADKYFGGVEELEKQYVDYILKLRAPPAGVIKGEYFVSEDFQFEFKAPGPEWQFYEDLDNEKLLVGLLLPGTSARIEIFYENNIYNKKPDDYFQDYLRFARHFENLKHEKVKIAGLTGYKLTYVDPGIGDLSFEIDVDDEGNVVVDGGDWEDGKPKKLEPREVVQFMLIQVDGVATIRCSTKKGEMEPYRAVFDKLNENFTLLFNRRW